MHLGMHHTHEFQPQVPTGRPQALGMQEREVSHLTSYPVCHAL
jgi:hypothetical protein